MRRPVGILVRISDDREDERVGVRRQEKDCRELCDRNDWEPVKVYTENDTSAFKRKRVTGSDGRAVLRTKRPGLRQALDDLAAGVIQGLAVYDIDRYARDPRDLEDLIDIKESTRYPVQAVTGSLQLDNDAGIMAARVNVAMANKSSRDTARRVARAARDRAERGEWHGGTPKFGFVPVKELVKGRERVVDLRPHPEHAAWVREAIDRLLAGETLYGICRDWNRQGRTTEWKRWQRDNTGGFQHADNGRRIKTDDHSTWYPRTLKRLVTAPAIAGYRELDGQLYPATWEPIVDREDWERVRILLSEPERYKRGWHTGNARKFALSGLVFCATCKNVMVSMTSNRQSGDKKINRKSFVCNELATGGCGSMRIEMHHLERYIFAQVFTRLDSPAIHAAVNTKADDIDDREKELRRAVTDGERRLERVEDEYDRDEITKAEYQRRRKKIREQLDADQAVLGAVTRSRVHTRLPSGTELRAVWDSKDDTWRRTVLSSIIERIEISRHPVGVASNLTPRKNESAYDFTTRLDLHRAKILDTRLTVDWWR